MDVKEDFCISRENRCAFRRHGAAGVCAAWALGARRWKGMRDHVASVDQQWWSTGPGDRNIQIVLRKFRRRHVDRPMGLVILSGYSDVPERGPLSRTRAIHGPTAGLQKIKDPIGAIEGRVRRVLQSRGRHRLRPGVALKARQNLSLLRRLRPEWRKRVATGNTQVGKGVAIRSIVGRERCRRLAKTSQGIAARGCVAQIGAQAALTSSDIGFYVRVIAGKCGWIVLVDLRPGGRLGICEAFLAL